MKIYLANDHAIFGEQKLDIMNHLKNKGHQVVNLGSDDSVSVDYPDFGKKCGEAVVNDIGAIGIVICGTGIGISIAANKVKGVRCALCHTIEYAKLARQHNNANIISMGARFLSAKDMIAMIDIFITTKFEAGRHESRVKKIAQ